MNGRPRIRNRFPGADVLAERGHWDDATRRVVLDRVHNVPEFRCFDGERRRTLEALCNRVIPQDHHPAGRRVPIAPWIDQRCADDAIEGFRYEDMPPHGDAWRRGLDGLNETSRALFGAVFADLSVDRQGDVLRSIRSGDPPGDTWRSLPARRWWIAIALREITGIYYAHPAAWDEIGFGGPAYPRGYAALNHGARETWEAAEDEAARREDEAERVRRAAFPDGLALHGTVERHLQALATTAEDGTGPRPAEEPSGAAAADSRGAAAESGAAESGAAAKSRRTADRGATR